MAEPLQPPPPPRPAVVTVGDELVLGERDDGNRRWLLAQLQAHGHPAEIALSLPDDVALIGYWVAAL
ncbi:MAG TPA: molybdopterin-binding protein, partial [Gammaproteobacteria bacterium]